METQPNQLKEAILTVTAMLAADRNSAFAGSTVAQPSLNEAHRLPALKRRTLKIEAIGDFARGKIKPRIRLVGQWLEQAGFKPGHRVEISSSKAGEMVLQFQETPITSDLHRLSKR